MQQKKSVKKIHHPDECPITATIDVIGGKWKPPVIWLLLKEGTLRFGEIKSIIPSIALKVLSRTLKELESSGVILRKVYPEVPPRVEYSLTEKGESLREIMSLLSNWSLENIMLVPETVEPV